MTPMQATLFGVVNQPVIAMAGTWDPLLSGHVEVLTRLSAHAHSQNLTSLLIMFDPSPAYFISRRKDETAQWITYNELQLTMDQIFGYGIDAILVIHFKAEYLDFGVAELFQTVASYADIAGFWFGARQSFGPGASGSQTALLQLAKEQGIKLKRLASTTVNEVCGQVRHYIASGKPGQASRLALTPVIREKPPTGTLFLPWPSGSYQVVPFNKIADIKTVQTMDDLREKAIDLPLHPAAEKSCVCDWPDTNINYLAFISGPYDNFMGNISIATD